MKDIIKLDSHDGSNNYLEKLNTPERDNHQGYLLKTQFNYIRFIYNSEYNSSNYKSIESVDPSGGPMLNVGSKIRGTNYEIIEINSIKYVGTIITLKKVEDDSKQKGSKRKTIIRSQSPC